MPNNTSPYYLLFLALSFCVSFNTTMFILSEEVLVFFSSMAFVFGVFMGLRRIVNFFYFCKAYQIFSAFIYFFLLYTKFMKNLRLAIESLYLSLNWTVISDVVMTHTTTLVAVLKAAGIDKDHAKNYLGNNFFVSISTPHQVELLHCWAQKNLPSHDK